MKTKILLLIAFLSLLAFAGSKPEPVIRLTIINKSEMEIAVQLQSRGAECLRSAEKDDNLFYYLKVAAGSRAAPASKDYYIRSHRTYLMQVYYLETWDFVYGFDCKTPKSTALISNNNLRLTILPCDEGPCQLGERTMWKFLPFPKKHTSLIQRRLKRQWLKRLIY